MTALSKMEAMLIQGAEDCRKRALDLIDRDCDPILIAQDLEDAAESYREAAVEIALRQRKAKKIAEMKEAVNDMKGVVRRG